MPPIQKKSKNVMALDDIEEANIMHPLDHLGFF